MPTPSTGTEKAYLALVKPPARTETPKLSDVKSGRVKEVVLTFNPKEISISKGATWNREPQVGAVSAAMAQFRGSQPATLNLEILLDASEQSNPDVTEKAEALLDAVKPLKQTLDSEPSPPWVVFGWGKFVSFVAVVTSVTVRYTLFRPDGVPVRATASLTLEEMPTDPPPRQNPTSGAITSTRVHTVVAGDTLHSIAFAEYRDPARWRDIAEANGIDDPMRLTPGTTVLIPDLNELET